ncbi:uncharacterized protein VTP21DRAFT_4211 [Calcarisporiella thermophila]|uniref:uncharacterized protein n=1 Tax=Calcarisporiella thermophila TaxID=911321 RepID=UPI0037442AD7
MQTNTMNFGPEWMRRFPKSSTGDSTAARSGSPTSQNASSLPNASSSQQSFSYSSIAAGSSNARQGTEIVENKLTSDVTITDKLNPFKYSRELMLSLFKASEIPLEFERYECVTAEEGFPPLSLIPMTEEEKKLFSGNVNSDITRRMVNHTPNERGERPERHSRDRRSSVTSPAERQGARGRGRDYFSSKNKEEGAKEDDRSAEAGEQARSRSHGLNLDHDQKTQELSGQDMWGGASRYTVGSFDADGVFRVGGSAGELLEQPNVDKQVAGNGELPAESLASHKTSLPDEPSVDRLETKHKDDGEQTSLQSKPPQESHADQSSSEVEVASELGSVLRTSQQDTSAKEHVGSRFPAHSSRSFDVSHDDDVLKEAFSFTSPGPSRGSPFTSPITSNPKPQNILAGGFNTASEAASALYNEIPLRSPPIKSQWFYEDTSGSVQGPFSSKEMHDWYKAGFFSHSLLVRREDEARFRPLGLLISEVGEEQPFLSQQRHSPLPISMQQMPSRILQDPLNRNLFGPGPGSPGVQSQAQDQSSILLQKQDIHQRYGHFTSLSTQPPLASPFSGSNFNSSNFSGEPLHHRLGLFDRTSSVEAGWGDIGAGRLGGNQLYGMFGGGSPAVGPGIQRANSSFNASNTAGFAGSLPQVQPQQDSFDHQRLLAQQLERQQFLHLLQQRKQFLSHQQQQLPLHQQQQLLQQLPHQTRHAAFFQPPQQNQNLQEDFLSYPGLGDHQLSTSSTTSQGFSATLSNPSFNENPITTPNWPLASLDRKPLGENNVMANDWGGQLSSVGARLPTEGGFFGADNAILGSLKPITPIHTQETSREQPGASVLSPVSYPPENPLSPPQSIQPQSIQPQPVASDPSPQNLEKVTVAASEHQTVHGLSSLSLNDAQTAEESEHVADMPSQIISSPQASEKKQTNIASPISSEPSVDAPVSLPFPVSSAPKQASAVPSVWPPGKENKAPSLREIQAVEEREAAERKAAMAASSLAQQATSNEGRHTKQPPLIWDTPLSADHAADESHNSSTGQPAAPAWGSTSAPKKTLLEIQREEEEAKQRRNRLRESQAQDGSGLVLSQASGKRYADTVAANAWKTPSWTAVATRNTTAGVKTISARSQPISPPTSNGPRQITPSGAAPPAWDTETLKGPVNGNRQPGVQQSVKQASAGKSRSQPTSSHDSGNSKGPGEEFLRWLKQALRGLSEVNVEEFIQMLLTFPLDPPPGTMEIISESVYAHSQSLNGRRFAEEFVRRRKLDAQGLPQPAFVDLHRTAATTREDQGNSGFKVVTTKKTKKKTSA